MPRDVARVLAREKDAQLGDLLGLSELGKKFPDRPLDPEEAIEMANRDFDAGACLVVVEKSDVALVIASGTDALHRLMRDVGRARLVIECGPGADRFDIAKWLIREFGPDVNLENVDAEDAYIIEGMRHGLHRATDYEYFHAYRGKRLPSVPPVE